MKRKLFEGSQLEQKLNNRNQTEEPVKKELEPTVTEIPVQDASDDIVNVEVPVVKAAPEPVKTNTPQEEPKDSTKDTKPVKEVELTDDDLIGPIQEQNFKKLREGAKTLRYKLQNTVKENEELKVKLQAYETGVAVPDIITEKDAKIAELEPLAKMVNFKASDDYKQEVVIPIQNAEKDLKKYIGVEGFEESHILESLNYDDDIEINTFLSRLVNPVTAIELKAKLKGYKELLQKASELEKNPQKFMSDFEESVKARKEAEAQAKQNQLVADSQYSWVDSIKDIQSDERFTEFYKAEDDEGREAVPAVLKSAGSQYGKLVSDIIKKGLTRDNLKVLSKAVLHATNLGVALEIIKQQSETIKQLEDANKDYTKYSRPNIGTSPAISKSNIDRPRSAVPRGMEQKLLAAR